MNNPNNRKVLLIGKYPPMQGGIAAKTFWLYKKLAQTGFTFRVVTIEPENYSLPVKMDDIKVFSVNSNSIPWHIPDSNLYFERLLSKCFDALEDFTPDIIETNYLWPFCSVASFISQKLNKPLLIRHAGSDILKFHTNNEFRSIMKRYFEQAALIVTNNTCREIVSDLCNDKTKISLLDRYVPDPYHFHDLKSLKQYDILFAGKINYHWKLKGIGHLLEHIMTNKLHALFLCDGNYIDDIHSLIREKGLHNNIEIEKFVHPSEMPEIISKCKTVWCWDEEGGIDDFSNIVWEACYCNVVCLIDEKVEKSATLKYLKELFLGKILDFRNGDSMINQDDQTDLCNRLNFETKTKEFDNYISQNISIYNNI